MKTKVEYWLSLAYKMLRVRTALMMLLFIAIGDAATKSTPDYDYRLVLAAILVGCLFTSATSVNDIADEEIDKINLPKDKRRPLVNSQTPKKHLLILNFAAFIIALIIAAAIKPILIWLVLAAMLLNYIYSMPPVKISYRGFLAPLLLPLNYVFIPFLIGASLHPGGWDTKTSVLLIGLYVSFIGRIILKDFRDVKGDKMFGKRTFLVRYGIKSTCKVAAVAWIIGDLIISGLFISDEPFLVLLLQPFMVSILYILYLLSQEKKLLRQLTLVTLIGRLGNSVGLLLLTALTLQLYKYSSAKEIMLLTLVALFSVYASYYLYELYGSQKRDQEGVSLT